MRIHIEVNNTGNNCPIVIPIPEWLAENDHKLTIELHKMKKPMKPDLSESA